MCSALANLAPERTDELNQTLHGYTFEILDEARYVSDVMPSARFIRISTHLHLPVP